MTKKSVFAFQSNISILIVVTGLAFPLFSLVYVTRQKHANLRQSSPTSSLRCSDANMNTEDCPTFDTLRTRRHLRQQKKPFRDMLILLLSTSRKADNLTRMLSTLVPLTKETQVPVFVSTFYQQSTRAMEELRKKGVTILEPFKRHRHVKNRRPNVMGRNIGVYGTKLKKHFYKMLGVNSDPTSSCLPFEDTLSRTISTYNSSGNGTGTLVEKNVRPRKLEDQQRMPQGTSWFSSNAQRVAMNDNGNFTNYMGGIELKGSKSGCDISDFVKNSLHQINQKSEEYKYVVIMDDSRDVSPDIVRYFRQASRAFEIDPTLYCVSGFNPLFGSKSVGTPSRMLRTDEFISSGATMIKRELAEEIVNKFQYPLLNNKDKKMIYPDDPMSTIAEWLSFFRNRKLRACLIPSIPRVCPMGGDNCRRITQDYNLELNDIIRYQYSLRTIRMLTDVEPLGYDELPCSIGWKLEKPKNKTYYSVFTIMSTVDNDVSLHFVLKCLGVDMVRVRGGFDATFPVDYEGIVVMVVGTPYSRYGPSIPRGSPLIFVHEVGSDEPTVEFLMETRRFADSQDQVFNITNVPYELKDGTEGTNHTGKSVLSARETVATNVIAA